MGAAEEAGQLPANPAATARFSVDLAGQPALVTGASNGIGRAVALALARAGADVVVNYSSHPEAAAEVAHEIETMGRRALTFGADVSREDQVERMFAAAIGHFGTLHIVVANSGVQQDAAFDDMTLDQWNKVIGINLTGQFLAARAAVREFKRRGPRPRISAATGKIICMSSVHQEIPWAGHANYAASKGGVNMLMRTVAQEVAPLRIRVNAIAPGAIATNINRQAWDNAEARGKLLQLIPYQRIGTPEDVALTAAWLASDASDYVTGTTLYVDGGMTQYPDFAAGG